jgi:hypothetical protein
VSEFIVVDHPFIHPQACVVCTSQKGPTVDTGVERWGERLYVCRTCATRVARAYGFVKGPKLDELMAAADGLLEKEREVASLNGQLSEARLEAGGHRATIRQQKDKLDEQGGRLQTMAHIATELERQTRELTELAVGPRQLEGVAA